jgi:hypothetical protein
VHFFPVTHKGSFGFGTSSFEICSEHVCPGTQSDIIPARTRDTLTILFNDSNSARFKHNNIQYRYVYDLPVFHLHFT